MVTNSNNISSKINMLYIQDKLIIKGIRAGNYKEANRIGKQILVEHPDKDNYFNIAATLGLAQNYFYSGNPLKAMDLFNDAFARDKDINTISTNPVDRQIELETFKAEIMDLSKRDYKDIKSFWFSQAGWNYCWATEKELVDNTTKEEAQESLNYLSALGRINTPLWLQNVSGDSKESSKIIDTKISFLDIISSF